MVDQVVFEGNVDGAAPEGHDAKMAEVASSVTIDGVTPPAPVETKAEVTPEAPAEEQAKASEEEAPKDEQPQFSLTPFQEEFAKDGQLSAESYDKLAEAGYPKEIVDQYIAGQQALATQLEAQAFALVGGEDNYAAMVQWAAATMSQADKDAFNQALEGSPSQSKLAIQGLYKQYTDANGVAPTLLNGDAKGGAGTVSGFRSTAEMTAAMQDPRYKTDAAYRNDVAARVSASTFM